MKKWFGNQCSFVNAHNYKSLRKLFSICHERKTLNTFFSKLAFCNFDLWNTIPRYRIDILRHFFFFFRIVLGLSSMRWHENLEITFSNFVYVFSYRITFIEINFLWTFKKFLGTFTKFLKNSRGKKFLKFLKTPEKFLWKFLRKEKKTCVKFIKILNCSNFE